VNIIRKGEHIKDCGAVRQVNLGHWKSVWSYPEVVWANKYGNQTPKQRGYIAWLKIVCNDTRCLAEIWVPNDDVIDSILPKR
jgi:hypothetical protein